MLYYAITEIWVRNDAGHMVPLAVPGYGESIEEAQADSRWRAQRYPDAGEEERFKLRFASYRLRPQYLTRDVVE